MTRALPLAPPAADRWRRTLRRTEDGGETWRVVWRDELERVGPP